jgi:hypothetical protein
VSVAFDIKPFVIDGTPIHLADERTAVVVVTVGNGADETQNNEQRLISLNERIQTNADWRR